MEPLPSLEDDGLPLGNVGDWAERKYRLIAYYADMFATSMKDKWRSRVYIDLFAGPGRGRIAGSTRVIPTSPALGSRSGIRSTATSSATSIPAASRRSANGYPRPTWVAISDI